MDKAAENCISSAAMDELIAAHDGDVALCTSICCAAPSTLREARGAAALAADRCSHRSCTVWGYFLTQADVAMQRRKRPVSKLPPAEELPEYTTGGSQTLCGGPGHSGGGGRRSA